jgi:hypothetical protein
MKVVLVRLCSWLWLARHNSFLSNTELVLLAISTMVINVLGNEAYIIVLGLHEVCLIKNLTPSRSSLVRKRVRAT